MLLVLKIVIMTQILVEIALILGKEAGGTTTAIHLISTEKILVKQKVIIPPCAGLHLGVAIH